MVANTAKERLQTVARLQEIHGKANAIYNKGLVTYFEYIAQIFISLWERELEFCDFYECVSTNIAKCVFEHVACMST